MKRIPLTVLVFLLCGAANAQIPKGKMSIGINLSADYSRDDLSYQYAKIITYKWNVVTSPFFQYFIKENLGLGGNLVYSVYQDIRETTPTTSSSFITSIKGTSEWYGLGVFANKYWFVNTKWAFFLKPQLISTYIERTDLNRVENPLFTEDQQENRVYSSSWQHKANLSVGCHYFIIPKLAIQAQMEVAQFTYGKNNQTGGILKSQPYFMFGMNYVFH